MPAEMWGGFVVVVVVVVVQEIAVDLSMESDLCGA